MFNFYTVFVLMFFFCQPLFAGEDELLEPIQHKQDLSIYINKFCRQRGRSYVRIQNNIVVDCLTADTLWKIDYADNWHLALVNALFYGIYDNYLGDAEYAPKPGIVLIQEDSDDYRNMVQLKQIVDHYKFPLNLNIIENYSANVPESKNVQIELGKKKFIIIGE